MPRKPRVHPKDRIWFPKKATFWVVFDMSNGGVGRQRYLWWFDTRREALAHRAEHEKNGWAPLSEPRKVVADVAVVP